MYDDASTKAVTGDLYKYFQAFKCFLAMITECLTTNSSVFAENVSFDSFGGQQ